MKGNGQFNENNLMSDNLVLTYNYSMIFSTMILCFLSIETGSGVSLWRPEVDGE